MSPNPLLSTEKDSPLTIPNVRNMFFNFFQENSLIQTPNLLLVTEDESLNFTNSAIVRWKESFMAGRVNPSYGWQSCLRLSTISNPIDSPGCLDREFNDFLGYFNMVGATVPASEMKTFIQLVTSLFFSQFGIKPEDIKILSHSSMDFSREFISKVHVEYDSMPEESYSWKFDIDHVVGKGAAICVKHPNGAFNEIGQVLEISKDDRAIAYALGFGIETFLSRLGYYDQYDAWTIAQQTPLEYRFHGYLDRASCFGALCTIPEDVLRRHHTKEIRRVTKKLIDTEIFYNIPAELTNKIILDELKKIIK